MPRQRFTDFLLHALLMVGSVLLALGLGSWWQNREAEAQAAALYQQIVEELQYNHERLQEDLAENAVYLAQVEAALGGPMSAPPPLLLSYRVLSSTAWQTLHLTQGLPHLPPALVRALSGLYEAQQLYAEQARLLVSHRGSVAFSRTDEPAVLLRAHRFNLTMLHQVGAQLAQDLETFLAAPPQP